MRSLLLLLITCALLAGCMKRVPAKKPPPPPPPAKVPVLSVRSLGTPSALIDSTSTFGDQLPFGFPLNQGYGIDGSWRGPNQVKGTTGFERIGDFTVTKADDKDVDPKEVAATLEKWVASSGVRQTQSSGDGLRKTIEFGTDQTLGSISFSIRPDAPAKSVTFHLEVREQPRSGR